MRGKQVVPKTLGLALLAGAALAGCGGGGPDAVTAGTAPSGTAATTPAAERVAQEPPPVLRRHETPPGGLRRLVDYFQQGDGPPCTHLEEEAERGPLRFLFRADRIVELPHDRGPAASVGDLLGICLAGTAAAAGDAVVTIDAPGVDPLPAETGTTRFDANTHLRIRSEHGAGEWRFRASAGGETATATFTVGATPEPAYRVSASVALLYGMEPGQPFLVALYEPVPPRTVDQIVHLRARYVASAPGRAAADGTAVIPIDAERLLDECGYVKIQVGGRLLYDAANFLSGVCPPSPERYSSSADAPPRLLARSEAPPAGVAREVAYAPEREQLSCEAPRPTGGGLAIGVGADVTPHLPPADPPRPNRFDPGGGNARISHLDELAVCVAGLDAAGDVELTIDPPDQPPRVIRYRERPDPRSAQVRVPLGVDDDTGTWWVTARHAGRVATLPVEMGSQPEPAYRVVGSDRERPAIAFTSVYPDVSAAVSLYRVDDAGDRAAHVATLPVHGGQDGSGVLRLDTRGVRPGSCFVARMQVDGVPLPDRGGATSVFCPKTTG